MLRTTSLNHTEVNTEVNTKVPIKVKQNNSFQTFRFNLSVSFPVVEGNRLVQHFAGTFVIVIGKRIFHILT